MRWLEKRKHCLTASRSLWSPRPPPDHMRLLPPSPPDDDFPPLPPPPKICNAVGWLLLQEHHAINNALKGCVRF